MPIAARTKRSAGDAGAAGRPSAPAATGAFAGFGPGLAPFFTGLAQNNDKPWFEAHKAVWERDVRDPLTALLTAAATAFGGDVRIARPYRDIRFSNDKSPYKLNLFGVVAPPGSEAGLYAAVSAEGLYVGSGYYGIAPDQIARLTAAAADDESGPALMRIVTGLRDAGYEIEGETLKTVPRGYPKDHPRAALLRCKFLVAGRRLAADDPRLFNADGSLFALDTWNALAPLRRILDERVGPSAAVVPAPALARRRGTERRRRP